MIERNIQQTFSVLGLWALGFSFNTIQRLGSGVELLVKAGSRASRFTRTAKFRHQNSMPISKPTLILGLPFEARTAPGNSSISPAPWPSHVSGLVQCSWVCRSVQGLRFGFWDQGLIMACRVSISGVSEFES